MVSADTVPIRPRLLASYGRRRGRKLRTGKQELIDTLLPELMIELPEQDVLDPSQLFSNKQHFWLEIGFGGGEHLAHQAAAHPDTGIIGCEPYLNGVAGLLAPLREQHLDNVRIYNHDARLLIAQLPAACMERVFILYPDPWPKTRHRKRRLISSDLLTALARIMKSGAELRIATDDEDYCGWILERLLSHSDFHWLANKAEDWLEPPEGWISTRYEQKALAEARRPTYINAVRI